MPGNRQIIVACVLTLMAVGAVMIYSSTAVACGVNLAENKFVFRQVVWLSLSLVALFVFAQTDYHWLADRSRLFLLVTLAGLAAVLLLGPKVNGARRWFRVGSFSVQISEFAKVAVILYMASFLSRKREMVRSFVRCVLPALLVLGVTFGLILVEPDFGTAVLIAAVAVTMLMAAGVRWAHVLPLFLTAAPALFFLLRMKEYRWRRLLVFLDPWSDPQGAGYHVVQSLIALGCGGLAGVGPGGGLQKLGFLPEAETDFIFAIIGQETGFIGCVLLMAVFVVLFHAGLRVAKSAPDALGGLIAVGVTVLIGLQMVINVAVAVSAMPTKGISLPFVSFGGSSVLALSLGIGVLLNVAKHCPERAVPRALGAMRKERLA